MPAGLEITNDANTILIDSNHPCLVHTNTYTHSHLTYGPLGGVLTLSDATDNTVIAYQGDAFTTNSHVARPTQSNREFWWPDLEAGMSCMFYRFERVRNNDPGFGLILMDESGGMTFDATQKVGRVVDVLTSNATYPVPSGRRYALVFAQSRYQITYAQYDPGDGNGLIRDVTYGQTRGRVTNNGEGLLQFEALRNIGTLSTRVPVGTPLPENTVRGSALGVVLDVTGY